MTRQLSPIQQLSDNSAAEDDKATDNAWIDPRFVVVFAKDGAELGACKSFKINIQEIVSKYSIKQPEYMKRVTEQHQALKAQFEKRAYKELLEYCSDHLFPTPVCAEKKNLFKTMYTIDGTMLDTLEDLKSYCERPPSAGLKKKVLLRETQDLNDRDTHDEEERKLT